MPKPNRIFSLDLGMQNVGLAEFHSSANGGLTLHNWRSVELIVDPAADVTRPAQIEAAVAELRGSMSLGTRESATLVLPSQSVFSRFVKLPGATANDVEEIIGFEAQQNVPFPIDEVVWDHQIMGDHRGGSWDVVLVAIKADQLGEIVDSVTKGGIRPGVVDVSPIAIYNAFRFNYSDIEGSSLLIDMGARTTNLIFVEDERLFSRTIPVGGHAISAAVAKEFKQDITLAERLKIEKGFVGLGGAYAEPEDPAIAKIAKVVRNTMTRLHAEIARSISFYRQSQGGSAPVRAFLCGGTVTLPYMAEFFAEKLQIPIEHLNPLRNVTVDSEELAASIAGKTHIFGELVGGALRVSQTCPVEISLRPQKLVRELDLQKRKPFLVLASVCLLAAIGVWYFYFMKAAEITQQKWDEVKATVNELQGFATKLDAVAESRKKLEAEVAPLLLAANERAIWSTLLDELGKNLPPRFIWITSMEPVSLDGGAAPDRRGNRPAPPPPGQPPKVSTLNALKISGLYLANPPNAEEARIVDQFVNNLKSSPLFKIEDNSKVVTERTTADGMHWAYGYTIVLPLATPITQP